MRPPRDMTEGEYVDFCKKPFADDVQQSVNEALDGVVQQGARIRGYVLCESLRTINGERQDVYGSPENSFALIADYWTAYLTRKKNLKMTAGDVALMMTLFKIAREANQHKRDNILDAAGYLGIYADMQGGE